MPTVFALASVSAFVTSAFTGSAVAVAADAKLAMVEFSLLDFDVSDLAASVFCSVTSLVVGPDLSLSEVTLTMLEFSFCALASFHSSDAGVFFAVFTSSSSLFRLRCTRSERCGAR